MSGAVPPLRGLFCGAGHFAKIQLTAWRAVRGARIVALYNRTLERAEALQREFAIERISADYEALLDQVRPDFVDLCTAVETHLPLARAAAARGLPILCQKPLAPRIEAAEELVALCARHGVRLMANDNWRWQGWYREMKRLIDTGAVGVPQHARFVLRPGDGWGDEPYPLQPFFRAMERFVLLEVGGHYFDTMRYLLGEIAALHCLTRRRNPRIRAEDAALVSLEFAGGATALFDADRTACAERVRPPTNGPVTIEGSEGTLRLDEEGAIFLLRRGGREERHAYAIPPGYRGGSAVAAQTHFAECLRSGADFETEGRDYIAIERAVEACYRSAASGERVRVEAGNGNAGVSPASVEPAGGAPALPASLKARIGLVHATVAAVQPMVAAFRRHAPEAELMHFLDEGLLPLVNRDGLTPAAVSELERLVARAVASGAEGVLLTCSAFSPCVPQVQARFPVPVVSVDEAMLRGALEYGRRIGVVATVVAAGPATATLLREYAAEAGRAVEVDVCVVPEAFAALKNDHGARHDALVRAQIDALVPACDVVVLAQISMARAAEGGAPFAKPVLTSPETSIRAILSRLQPSAA